MNSLCSDKSSSSDENVDLWDSTVPTMLMLLMLNFVWLVLFVWSFVWLFVCMFACFVCRFSVDDDDANGCLLRGPTFMVAHLKSGHELEFGSNQFMKMMFMARMITAEVNPGGQICTTDSTCFP